MESDEILKIMWVALAVVLAASEIVVPGFFLLPFGLGAAMAALVAFLGGSFLLQLLVLAVSSAIFFLALRPLARRLNQIEDPEGVGANRLLNQRGVVIDRLGPDDPGLVRIDREDWRADSRDGAVFEPGDRVIVAEVRGTRVIVVADPSAPAARQTDPQTDPKEGPTS